MTVDCTGAVPVLATPFLPDETLDVDGLRRVLRLQLAAGVTGVAVFGMASEGFALTAQERRRILDVVRDEVGDRVSVIAGVNATSAHTAVEQTRLAADAGADMTMVLPPFLVRPTGTQVVEFYHAVATTTAPLGLEIMVQDAPGVTGVSLSATDIAAICRHTAVTAVKVEAPPTALKVQAVVRALGTADDVTVIGGQNALFLLEELRAGSQGTMPACEFVDRLPPVLIAARHGEWPAARAAADPLLPLIRFGMQPGIAWAVHKRVLQRRGVIEHDTVRAPAHPLDPQVGRWLDDLLDDLGLPSYEHVVASPAVSE